MTLLYGYLFKWNAPGGSDDLKSRANGFATALLSLGSFRKTTDRRLARAGRWATYQLETPKQLHGFEQDSLYPEAPYTYTVFCRVSEVTGTVILAGERYAVADEAVRLFNQQIRPAMVRKVVNVKDLSENLLRRGVEKTFAITFLLADVPGFGSSLSSIALYGDDIGAANFSLPGDRALTARQIGIRSLLSRHECARFGNLGSVQFRTDLIADFESILGYAYDNGFVAR